MMPITDTSPTELLPRLSPQQYARRRARYTELIEQAGDYGISYGVLLNKTKIAAYQHDNLLNDLIRDKVIVTYLGQRGVSIYRSWTTNQAIEQREERSRLNRKCETYLRHIKQIGDGGMYHGLLINMTKLSEEEHEIIIATLIAEKQIAMHIGKRGGKIYTLAQPAIPIT